MAPDAEKQQEVQNVHLSNKLKAKRFQNDLHLAKSPVGGMTDEDLLAAVAEMAIVAYEPDSIEREKRLADLGIGKLSELSESHRSSFVISFFDDIRRNRLPSFNDLPYTKRVRVEAEVSRMMQQIKQAKVNGSREPFYRFCETNIAINDWAVWIFCKLFEALALAQNAPRKPRYLAVLPSTKLLIVDDWLEAIYSLHMLMWHDRPNNNWFFEGITQGEQRKKIQKMADEWDEDTSQIAIGMGGLLTKEQPYQNLDDILIMRNKIENIFRRKSEMSLLDLFKPYFDQCGKEIIFDGVNLLIDEKPPLNSYKEDRGLSDHFIFMDFFRHVLDNPLSFFEQLNSVSQAVVEEKAEQSSLGEAAIKQEVLDDLLREKFRQELEDTIFPDLAGKTDSKTLEQAASTELQAVGQENREQVESRDWTLKKFQENPNKPINEDLLNQWFTTEKPFPTKNGNIHPPSSTWRDIITKLKSHRIERYGKVAKTWIYKVNNCKNNSVP